jgi:hypothetical protein
VRADVRAADLLTLALGDADVYVEDDRHDEVSK